MTKTKRVKKTIREEMQGWFQNLIAQLPDWNQFATKAELNEIKEEIIIVKDILVGMNSKFDQEYASVHLHLNRHDKEIAELQKNVL